MGEPGPQPKARGLLRNKNHKDRKQRRDHNTKLEATRKAVTDLAEPRRLNPKQTWKELRINTKIKGTEINSTGANG